MSIDDGWDWPWLYYVGTVLLRMTEDSFWRCAPRKLAALTAVHVEINDPNKERNPDEQIQTRAPTIRRGYIDQVLF